MLTDKDALIVYGYKLAPFLVDVEYGYNKIWGSDTGRNMKASMSGTLLGIVVKLKLTFGRLTREQIELISPKNWKICRSAQKQLKLWN